MTHRRVVTGLAVGVLLLGVFLHPHAVSSTVYSASLPAPPLSVAVDPRLRHVFVTLETPLPYPHAVRGVADTLAMLDLASGAPLSSLLLPLVGPTVVLAVDAPQQRLFVGGSGTTVATLDTARGTIQHVADLGLHPLTAVVDDRRGRAIVLCTDGTLGLLAVSTGTLLRHVRLGYWAAGLALDSRTQTLFVSRWGPFDGGRVSLLDAGSLRLRRTLHVGHSAGALAVAPQERRVFVLRPADKAVSVLDEHGTLLGTVRVGQSGGSGALAVDEHTARVFVTNTRDNTVSVLDARTGQVVQTVRIGYRPDALLVDDRAHSVVVVNSDDGTLSVLDARSGAVQRTLVVGPNPTAAVDAATGRVVVASGTSVPPAPTWMERLVQAAPWLPVHLTPAAALPGSVRLLDLDG